MIKIGEIRNTRRKPGPFNDLSTTNPTWTELGSKTGPGGDSSANDRVSYGTESLKT